MKRILIAGAGGYIGIPCCEALLNEGNSVIGLDRYFFGEDKVASLKAFPDFQLLKDDTRYFDTTILKDVDAVIDLAGLSNDAAGELNPELTQAINYDGAIRLAKAAKECGVSRYIYSSSASVYGEGKKIGLTEKDSINPLTEYAKSKAATEKEVLELNSDSFCVTVLRNATVFGIAPRMRFDLAVNIMVARAWKEGVIYVMGGGQQWRPLIHVKDVVKAFCKVLTSPVKKVAGEIFNVGSNELNFMIKQLANLVYEQIPTAKIQIVPDYVDKRDYHLSFDKINKVLQYETEYTVVDGAQEVKEALIRELISMDDLATNTVLWYREMLEWNNRLEQLKLRGRLL